MLSNDDRHIVIYFILFVEHKLAFTGAAGGLGVLSLFKMSTDAVTRESQKNKTRCVSIFDTISMHFYRHLILIYSSKHQKSDSFSKRT